MDANVLCVQCVDYLLSNHGTEPLDVIVPKGRADPHLCAREVSHCSSNVPGLEVFKTVWVSRVEQNMGYLGGMELLQRFSTYRAGSVFVDERTISNRSCDIHITYNYERIRKYVRSVSFVCCCMDEA